MDLLVYGTNTSFDIDNVTSIDKVSGSGTDLEAMDIPKLKTLKTSLTPGYGQKYGGNFYSAYGLTHTVYALKDSSGKIIADLIFVSENGSTISVSGGTDSNPKSKSFTFETIVTDPQWYLSNSDKTVSNTAMLFSANNKVNERNADVKIDPKTTKKDMLKADASTNPILNKNKGTTNSSEGFNYKDKSVIFRLFVNQNGVNATGGITTTDSGTVGDIIVEDVLPEGWEFVDIEGSAKFYIFKASGTPNSMTAGDRITEYNNILTFSDFSDGNRKATFTFEKLEEPYVIFVKARPSESTLKSYFDDNKTTTKTNTLSFKSSQHQNPVDTKQDIKVKSQILDKSMIKVGDGILKWTVSYRPYDIFQDVKILDKYRLIDTLPEGLDVYTDSRGKLDFSGSNFTVTEMVLNPSGYTATGAVFTDQQLRDSISYDTQAEDLYSPYLIKKKLIHLSIRLW